MTEEKSEYDLQAEKFLKDTNTEFKVEFLKHGKHFEDDTESRDIYKITLTRVGRVFKFDFGQSLDCSGLRLFNSRGERTRHKNFSYPKELRHNPQQKNPTREQQTPKRKFIGWFEKEHFVLRGLIYDFGKEPTAYDVLASLTTYDPDTFEEFCSSYGYDTDSRKAEKTYKAVLNEWNNIKMLYSDKEIDKLQKINY